MSQTNQTAVTRSEEKRKPATLRECRTFGDLMELRAPSTGYLHHCKRCRAYGAGIAHWHYSVRASICEPCAVKAKDELLPRVAAAERKARSWVKNHADSGAQFIASLSGASIEFVEAEIAKVRK